MFYKQRDALFFPPWAYVVPTTLGRLPVSFVETTIWVGECMLQTFRASLQQQGWFCMLRHYVHCSPPVGHQLLDLDAIIAGGPPARDMLQKH